MMTRRGMFDVDDDDEDDDKDIVDNMGEEEKKSHW